MWHSVTPPTAKLRARPVLVTPVRGTAQYKCGVMASPTPITADLPVGRKGRYRRLEMKYNYL